MEHSREHYPEPAWIPTEDIPALRALRTKGIVEVSYPEEPEAQRDAWRKSKANSSSEIQTWVAIFDAVTTEQAPTKVYFVAMGTAEHPYVDADTVLGFTVGEWDAFAGGVGDGEFDL